jgi:S1-C subfamily serine protease
MLAADSTIAEGEGVLIIGFPLGLGADSSYDHPVSRLGMVAQGIYDQPSFLVDGMASHGNSGSPVFLCRNGALAGMARLQTTDHIDAYDEHQRPVVRLPYNAGLAVCIPASTIRRFLNGLGYY